MSAEGVEQPNPAQNRRFERLNSLLWSALDNELISQESANRMLELNQASEIPVVDPRTVDLIPDLVLPSVPVIQALRHIEDFTSHETVHLKADGLPGLQVHTLIGTEGPYLIVQRDPLLQHYVKPTYIGLFTDEDYMFHKVEDFPGAGGGSGKGSFPKTVLSSNTAISRALLSYGVGEPVSHQVLNSIRRNLRSGVEHSPPDNNPHS